MRANKQTLAKCQVTCCSELKTNIYFNINKFNMNKVQPPVRIFLQEVV